jgi:hypothetical protein
MKFSWNSVKISIAGAKLSHLSQKDKIWDHGSMVELVKNVFYKIEKAKTKNDPALIKKNLTEKFYMVLSERLQTKIDFGNGVLIDVNIIAVRERTNKTSDHFTALVRGKRKNVKAAIENFSEKWFFVRVGDWWLLDRMK